MKWLTAFLDMGFPNQSWVFELAMSTPRRLGCAGADPNRAVRMRKGKQF